MMKWTLLGDAFNNPALLEPPPAIVPRFAYEGRLTLLSTPEKSGKTTLIGLLVATLTAGQKFLGDRLDPAHVLWLGLDEHEADVVRRLHRFGADGARLHYATELPEPEEIEAQIRRTGARLCVLDTVSEMVTRLGLKPNVAEDVLQVLRMLREISRRTGCAFIMLHHTIRDGSRYAGSAQIGASVDLILEWIEKGTRREVKRPRGRVKVMPFALDFDQTTDRYRLAGEEESLEDKVIRAIQRHPGLSMSGVIQAIGARQEDVRVAVRRLEATSRVADRGTSRRASLHVVDPQEVFAAAGPIIQEPLVPENGSAASVPTSGPIDFTRRSQSDVSAGPTTPDQRTNHRRSRPLSREGPIGATETNGSRNKPASVKEGGLSNSTRSEILTAEELGL